MQRSSPVTGQFASTDVVTLVRRSMQESGLERTRPAARATSARMPFGAKREILAEIASRHGLGPLLEVGNQLVHVKQEPVVAALLAAHDVPDLFARWSRLEAIMHSHHRVRVKDFGSDFLVAEHISLGETPPTDFEHILIFGILSAAIPLIGAEGVTVSPDSGATMLPVTPRGAVSGDWDVKASPLWRFEWKPIVRPSQEMATDPIRGVGAFTSMLRADPTRRWTVAVAAASLNMSTRTFQRSLGSQGGFAAVVGAVRAQRSAELLLAAREPLSTVAFICGYSDQPHFTREFKRRTGMTPSTYRLLFNESKKVHQ